jgi:hypothetical protein
MERYNWSHLKPLQLGRYAEYLVKMEFTLYGFDVYTAEVDDKGIDFVIRKEEKKRDREPEYRYYDVQMKSVRAMNYIERSELGELESSQGSVPKEVINDRRRSLTAAYGHQGGGESILRGRTIDVPNRGQTAPC